MNRQNPEEHLIEYIAALMNMKETSGRKKPEDLSSEMDVHMIQTANEIIKFMDKMPGGFLIYHADGNEEIIYANKALIRIFQCDDLEDFRRLTKNSFRGIVHYEDLDEIEKSIQEQISHSQYDLDYVEYRIIRKDGEIRWIEDYGHFVHNESVGDIFYVFLSDATEKIERNLTEKSALMNAKERSEQKIQNLIEEYDKERKLIHQEHLRRLEVIEGLSINYESILYADLDEDKILPYRLSCRNEQQFQKRFQIQGFLWYSSDYVKTWVHPQDREMVTKYTDEKYIRQKLSETNTYYLNYRVIQDEEIQYIQLRVVNVGSREHISQIVMGYRSVDEEIRQEMKQKQILKEALNNANLAINAKNTFLSNMSHDMRTPLNGVFGYAALAKSRISDKETVQDCLEHIEASGKQLLDLIEKVLKISWTESNDMYIEETEFDLHDIIQEVYKRLILQASDKNVALSADSEKIEHCNVCGDKAKLIQVLLYLGENAVKYTKSNGKVGLSVKELERMANDYAVYQFIIKDTGIGINEEFQKNIFEPFEREKNTTFSGIHGTGLGLTIARNIVEMMGGKIEVNSMVGVGSVFTVTLRFRIQASSENLFTDTEKTIAKLKNQKILLVEDNEINREIETEILKEIGFCVEAVENGSVAVEKMRYAKPYEYILILMDIQMPVMDGRKAAEAIRKLENPVAADIPIIALSADAFESDKRMSMESGINAHLPKPVDVPQLLDAIAKAVQIHKIKTMEE